MLLQSIVEKASFELDAAKGLTQVVDSQSSQIGLTFFIIIISLAALLFFIALLMFLFKSSKKNNGVFETDSVVRSENDDPEKDIVMGAFRK